MEEKLGKLDKDGNNCEGVPLILILMLGKLFHYRYFFLAYSKLSGQCAAFCIELFLKLIHLGSSLNWVPLTVLQLTQKEKVPYT